MRKNLVIEILDRYEKATQELIYYKQRVERHEQQIRTVNRENQQLKANMHFLEAKLEQLKNTENETN
jgi:phage shock protein A